MTITNAEKRKHISISILGGTALLVASSAVGVEYLNGIDVAALGPRTTQVDLGAYARLLYVAPRGNNTPESGTRDNPYASLDYALQQTEGAGGEERYAVLIAAGRYVTVNVPLRPFVDVYGGFDAKIWHRDVRARRSVLDAAGRNRGLLGSNHCLLDGCVITGGRYRGHGGALFCEDASMMIRNNTFIDNGTLQPQGLVRKHLHQPANTGGAITLRFKSACEITNNLFAENFTEIGAGGAVSIYEKLRMEDRKITIRGNVFLNNRAGVAAPREPWTRTSNGGAIACILDAHPEILHNVFVGNQARENSDGGAIYAEYGSNPHIRGNWFVGNYGHDDGGALYSMKMSEPLIEDNLVVGNTVVRGVGAIRIPKEGRAHLRNNVFAHNAYNAIVVYDGWASLTNNTLIDNTPSTSHETGADVVVDSLEFMEHYRPMPIEGNILYGGGGIFVGKPQVDVRGNSIEGWKGSGNVDEQPVFIDDGTTFKVNQAEYNASLFVTEFKVEGQHLKHDALAGRVLHYGDRWSVIQKSTDHTIVAWDDLTRTLFDEPNQADNLDIVKTYTLSEDWQARGLGAR